MRVSIWARSVSAGFTDVEVASRSRAATETLTEEEIRLLGTAQVAAEDLARMIVSVKVQAHKPA